jgi:signal peptidase I
MIKRTQAWFDRQAWIVQIIILVLIVFIVRTFGFGLYQVPTGSMETTMLVGERFFADKLTIWFSPIQRGEIISFNSPLDENRRPYPYSKNILKNLWQRYVWGPSNWTKRVIGIPGDHIEGKLEDGKPVVYINGKKIDEPYLNKYPLIPAWTRMPNLQSRTLFQDACLAYFSFVPGKPWTPQEQPFYGNALKPEQIIRNNPHFPIREPGTPLESTSGKIEDEFDVILGENQYWVMGDNRLGSMDSRSWGPLDGTLIHGRIKFCIFSLDSLSGWWIFDLLLHPISFWSTVRWSRCLNFVK